MDNTYKPDSILELEKEYGITLKNMTGLEVDYKHKKHFQLNENGEVISLCIRDGSIKEIRKMELLSSLITLDLSYNQICKLQGLDKLISLKNLWLSNNRISKIERLDKLINLKRLSLNNNQISRIEGFDELISLEYLYLDNNQFGKFEGLNKLINLKGLSLNNNQISKIGGFDELISLEYLYLDNNQFGKFEGLNKLINLKGLSLNNNQISKIGGLDKLINLEELQLNNNRISKLEGLDKLISLKYLWLKDNQITKLEGLDELISLEYLWLNNNQITKLEGLDKLTNLQNLSLNNNQISKIEGLDKLIKLKTLSLESNLFRKLEGLDKLIKLKTLSLESNLFRKLEGLDKLISLEYLRLNNNQITKLEGLDKLINLEYLWLNNNQITKLEGLDKLIKLKTLSLESNLFRKLEGLDELISLKNLSLDNNQFSKLEELDKLTNLQNLSLNNNQISKIEGLDKLKSLRGLFLFNNQISKIEGLDKLTNLQELSLNDNQIKKIEGIDKLTDLTNLSINNNKISKIEGLDKLEKIWLLGLDYNKIVSIEGLDKLKSLHFLFLSNNQIKENIESLEEVLRKPLTLHIDGNKFLQDREIILESYNNHRDDILNLLAEEKEKKVKFEYPYKVMLLGNHEAGKSTFLRYYDKKYTLNGSTHILQIFKSRKKYFPKINFYDFGGQDYYHGIYQVFFSSNALNMLFWCDKTDRNKKEKDSEGINILNFNRAYWLSQIRYASQRKELYQSKVEEDTFVIQTHADNSKQRTIEKTAPQVIEQFFVSLPDTKEDKDPKGEIREWEEGYDYALRYLEFRLKGEIEKKDTQKEYPKSQIELYNKVQSLQKETGYDYGEIRELFPNYKESLLKAKLYQLYRKGEILYYRGDKELENVVWLNPTETVKHIHSILSKDSMKEMKGRVPKGDMEKAFKKDPLLLRLLEIEKVIFHDQKKGVYIIPGYLPLAEEDEAYSWLTIGFLAPNFTLKFENFIPFGLINQLICYYGSEENELKRYWRDQLIFTLGGEYMVWIALDFEKLKIEVYINPLSKGEQTRVAEIEEEIFLDLFCFYWDKRPLQKGIESETPKFSQRERESENKTQRVSEIRNRIKQELNLERKNNPIPDLYISRYDPKLKPEGQLYVKLQKLDDPEQTKSTITAYPLTQEGEIDREKEQRVSTKRYKHFSINPALKSVKRIFISYSKSDIDDLNELNKFLTDMIREEKIEVYYDKTTTPGDLIHEVIKEKIIEADYVIALVSQNYISTDYIRDVELPLIKEHNKPLIPIIIKPCTWTMNDISKHYAVLKGAEISFPDWNKGSNPDNYNACRSENWRKAVEELNEKIFTNKYN